MGTYALRVRGGFKENSWTTMRATEFGPVLPDALVALPGWGAGIITQLLLSALMYGAQSLRSCMLLGLVAGVATVGCGGDGEEALPAALYGDWSGGNSSVSRLRFSEGGRIDLNEGQCAGEYQLSALDEDVATLDSGYINCPGVMDGYISDATVRLTEDGLTISGPVVNGDWTSGVASGDIDASEGDIVESTGSEEVDEGPPDTYPGGFELLFNWTCDDVIAQVADYTMPEIAIFEFRGEDGPVGQPNGDGLDAGGCDVVSDDFSISFRYVAKLAPGAQSGIWRDFENYSFEADVAAEVPGAEIAELFSASENLALRVRLGQHELLLEPLPSTLPDGYSSDDLIYFAREFVDIATALEPG